MRVHFSLSLAHCWPASGVRPPGPGLRFPSCLANARGVTICSHPRGMDAIDAVGPRRLAGRRLLHFLCPSRVCVERRRGLKGRRGHGRGETRAPSPARDRAPARDPRSAWTGARASLVLAPRAPRVAALRADVVTHSGRHQARLCGAGHRPFEMGVALYLSEFLAETESVGQT